MGDSSYTAFMFHHTARESFRKLSERINRFPQGASPTDLLFQIIKVLFTPAESKFVALLPIKRFTVEQQHAFGRSLKPKPATSSKRSPRAE